MGITLKQAVNVTETLTTDSPDYDAYKVVGEAKYDTAEWSAFTISLYVASQSGSTPTLDVRIEHAVLDPSTVPYSPWVTLKDFAQVTTTTGVTVLSFPDGTIYQWGRFVRVLAKVGGTTPIYVINVDFSPRG